MGLQLSKDQVLYQQAAYGNVEAVKALRRHGAGLEWVDAEGKTPLMLACLKPDGLPLAKALIELGADVNAYRPGQHAGTPLHHAAKRGLDQIVNLLLSHGANALKLNDDCQTPLDLARLKGHLNVVRTIENHICLFSGWLRELYGPGFLEAFAAKWISRKVWAVITPCDQRNTLNVVKCDLAVYPEFQAAQPRVVIPLWKSDVEEIGLNQPDPAVIIFDKSTKTRYKFLSAHEGDKQQLLLFYYACRGMLQANTTTPANPSPSPPPSTMQVEIPASVSEARELALAITASIQSAIEEGTRRQPTHTELAHEDADMNGWADTDNSTLNGWGPAERPASPSPQATHVLSNLFLQATHGLRSPSPQATHVPSNEPSNDRYNGWDVPEPARTAPPVHKPEHVPSVTGLSTPDIPPVTSTPSAPPLASVTFASGPVHYPSVDTSPIVSDEPAAEAGSRLPEAGLKSRSCVICLDSPVEGACIPCGHMAGCMSCLKEIREKKWGCPVCRAKIDQVVRLYTV